MTPPDPETVVRARMPADVDAPDKVLYGLTFRQLAILAVAAVVFAAGWHLLHPLLPAAVLVVVAVPLGGIVFAIAVGRRDGLTLDVWLTHAIRCQRAPAALSTADTTATLPPWVTPPTDRVPLPAPLRLPAQAIDDDGTITLTNTTTSVGGRLCRDRRRDHRQPHPAHTHRTSRAARHVRPVAQLTHPPHPDRHRQPTRRPALRRRHPHHPRTRSAKRGVGGGVRRPRRIPDPARPPPRPAAAASPHHQPCPNKRLSGTTCDATPTTLPAPSARWASPPAPWTAPRLRPRSRPVPTPTGHRDPAASPHPPQPSPHLR